MLVLTRKPGEKVIIGGNIIVTVLEIKGQRVRLAFEAPDEVTIMRQELVARDAFELSDSDLIAKPDEWNVLVPA